MKCAVVALLALLIPVPVILAEKLNDQWELTFTERFRLVSWDNAITLDDAATASRTFTRHRTQLGTVWSPTRLWSFALRFANEFRYYTVPSTRDFHFDEIFVDQLYARLQEPWQQPVSLTLGRQNIILGEGFIVMDGHPLDGSRSIYFNAVRLDWTIRRGHRLTAFASYKDETDHYLPVVHSQDQPLVEQPETGFGVYYFGHFGERIIDGYFVRKERDGTDAVPYSSTTNTIGGRLEQTSLTRLNLKVAAEAAFQFGEYEHRNRRAFGGYGYAEYKPAWSSQQFYLPGTISGGLIVLSGDDPATDQFEDWDPMFARWPKWSESYIYTQIQEDAVAWWTNMVSLYGVLQFTLSPNVDLRFDYHHLLAYRKPDDPSGFPGGDGATRGDLFIGKLSFKFDRHWSGHLLWEGFAPGNYYFDEADAYAWLRTEVLFRY